MTETFGQRVRAARVRQGVSVYRLAKDADVDPKTVVKTEAGESSPTLRIADRLARALGVPLASLLDEGEAA